MSRRINDGKVITFPALAAAAAGDIVVVGNLVGLNKNVVTDVGDPMVLEIDGEIETPKVGSQVWAVGDKVYWDAANSRATKTAGSLKLMGFVGGPAAANDSVGRVVVHPAS